METSRPLDSHMQTFRTSPSWRTPLTSVAFDGGPSSIPLSMMISQDMVSGSKKKATIFRRACGEGARFLDRQGHSQPIAPSGKQKRCELMSQTTRGLERGR